MKEITTIGLDLAKNVFQLHAITKDGTVAARRQPRRSQVLPFFERLPPCLVGMEAGAGSHHWARELIALGHDVRLMPPGYVKPYVKRQKNDAADAEAICEAVTRPTMRFTPAKTEAQQAAILLHRTREFLVRQRTQIANVLRAYAAEFGIVVATGVQNVPRLLACIEDDERLPDAVRPPMRLLAEQFHALEASIAEVTGAISEAHKADETSRRLATIPGVGLLTASLVSATTPDVSNFRSGTRLRRVARADAKAAFQRGQGADRPAVEDGKQVHPTTAVSRGAGANSHPSQARSGGPMACRHAGEEARQARRDRAGQSHGPRHLDPAENGGSLQIADLILVARTGSVRGMVRAT